MNSLLLKYILYNISTYLHTLFLSFMIIIIDHYFKIIKQVQKWNVEI